jgi:UDP-glucose 4-epimerase
MKNVIVTGGCGYIGSHTIIELIKCGYNPIIIDDFSNSDKKIYDKICEITNHDIYLIEKSLDSVFILPELSNNMVIDGIIHFAAYKSVNESIKDPIKYYDNNIKSTINVLKMMEYYDIKNLIFSSSCTVYGEPDVIPVTETSEIKNPTSPYGATKQMCERIIDDFHNSSDYYNVVKLRYFNPIGAHPSGLIGEIPNGIPNNLVPYLTQTAIGKRDVLKIYGNDYDTEDGTCIRDFIHVCDLANAHVSSLNYIEDKRNKNFVFNVGTGLGTSVLELIQMFEDVNDIKLNWVFDKRREGDIVKIWANTDLITNTLNWKPIFSVKDGLKHSWEWEKNIPNIII